MQNLKIQEGNHSPILQFTPQQTNVDSGINNAIDQLRSYEPQVRAGEPC